MPAIFIGGSLFLAVILLAGYCTPGYSHTQHSISELGISGSVHGWLVQWVGFVPLGLSFILFAFQSSQLFSNQIPFNLIFLAGLATLSAGMFPTDPENRRDTESGKIHAGSVIALMLLLNAAPFTFSIPAFYRDPPAEWFFVFSVFMGILMLILFISSSDITFPRLERLSLKKTWQSRIKRQKMPGLEQRLLLSLQTIWWFVFSQVLADNYSLPAS